MTDKREARRQRAEEARQQQAQAMKQRVLGRRVLMVLGALAVGGLIYAATSRGRAAGRVWSAEHGHWHEAT